MNDYLKSAVGRYKDFLTKKQIENEGYKINPISKFDAEIFIELKELIKKSGNEVANTILKEYKLQKDEDILDQLRQCNIDTPDSRLENLEDELDEGVKKETAKDTFLIINNERFASKLIFGYSPKDESTFDEEKYKIILNPCKKDATKLPYYANHTFEFFNEEDFKKTMELIDKQMKESNVKFVNGDNED